MPADCCLASNYFFLLYIIHSIFCACMHYLKSPQEDHLRLRLCHVLNKRRIVKEIAVCQYL